MPGFVKCTFKLITRKKSNQNMNVFVPFYFIVEIPRAQRQPPKPFDLKKTIKVKSSEKR